MTARSRQFWAQQDQHPIVTSDPRTVNLDQAVALTKLSRRSLYYWMREGLLPFVKVRGTRRVTIGALETVKRYSEHGRARTWCQ